MKNSILIYFLIISGQIIGQSVFVCTGAGALWKTNPNTCVSSLVGSCPVFQDIAFLPNGNLYGLNGVGIYLIDTSTAVSTLISTTSIVRGSSFVGGSNGKLYSVGGSTLYEIDIIANTSTILGTVGCASAGDLSFFNGELYLTCVGNGLIKIDLTTTPITSTLIGTMVMPLPPWGLINTIDICSDKPFVMARNGWIYPLNYRTAVLGSPCITTITGWIYGAASPDEFINAGPINLGKDTTLCFGQNLELSVFGKNKSDYLWSDGSTNDTLTVTTSGQYWLRVTDTVHLCQYYDTINVTILSRTNALRDTTITECFVGSYNIQSRVLSPSSAVWVNSNYSPLISPSSFGSPGTYQFYYIEAGFCADTAMVTVNILYDTFNLGSDTLFCIGGIANYSLNYPTGTFMWNTGSTLNNINVDTTGTYGVVMTNLATGCSFSDSVNVGVISMPDPGLNGTITMCDFNSVNLFNSIGGTPKFGGSWWFNGTPVSMPFMISSPSNGNYHYKVTNGFCVDSSIVYLTNIVPDLTPFYYAPRAFIASQTEVEFTNIASADSIRWIIDGVDFGNLNSFNHLFIKEGYKKVCLVLFNDNCTDTVCDLISVAGFSSLYIPNSFSPNDDGINDLFSPVFSDEIINFEFEIYNKWGEVIFKTNNLLQKWDGKNSNEYVKSDVYIWKMKYQLSNSTKTIQKIGHVHVNR